MGYVWQESGHVERFVGARRHLPHMRDLFEHAVWYVKGMRRGEEVGHIVDLGCGTGVTGGAMLGALGGAGAGVRLTLSDFSEPMLEEARKTYAGDERVRVVYGDLSEHGVMKRICGDEKVDLVVSSLAIHHLERRRQMALYGEIFEALEPGGVFVNMEHTASGSKAVEGIYWDHMYRHVTDSMKASGEETSYEKVKEEFEKRQGVNILTPVDVQVGWLRAIGFEDADCVFRSFELSVFGGRKPRG